LGDAEKISDDVSQSLAPSALPCGDIVPKSVAVGVADYEQFLYISHASVLSLQRHFRAIPTVLSYFKRALA